MRTKIRIRKPVEIVPTTIMIAFKRLTVCLDACFLVKLDNSSDASLVKSAVSLSMKEHCSSERLATKEDEEMIRSYQSWNVCGEGVSDG